jgi:hypothetical protein
MAMYVMLISELVKIQKLNNFYLSSSSDAPESDEEWSDEEEEDSATFDMLLYFEKNYLRI